MFTCLQLQKRILEYLYYLDDLETICISLETYPFFKGANDCIPPSKLTPLHFHLGYYQTCLSSSLHRSLIFLKKGIIIDYLSKDNTIPEWISDIKMVEEKVKSLNGMLGIGKYTIEENILALNVRYGKSIQLTFDLEMISKRNLLEKGITNYKFVKREFC